MPRPCLQPSVRASGRIAALVVIAAACIAVAGCGGDAPTSGSAASSRTIALLRGLPESDATLGQRSAPATLTVFADLTDAGFTTFEDQVLPAIVERFVRPGRLRARLRAVVVPSTLSDDAMTVARLTEAAALQDRAWQFAGVFSAEYVEYLDTSTVHAMLADVPGLNPRQALADGNDPAVARAVSMSGADQSQLGAQGSLAFVVDAPSARSVVLRPRALTAAAVVDALNRLVGPAPQPSTRPAPPHRTGRPSKPPARLTSPAPAQPPHQPAGPPFSGLPQSGFSLGTPTAPARLAIYVDLTAGDFRAFERSALPQLLSRYVRPGRLLLQLRTVSAPPGKGFAEQVARTVQAVGLQDRLWQLADVLARRNARQLTPSTLVAALRALPGLDARRVLADSGSATIRRGVALSERRARESSIGGPLGFALQRSGRTQRIDAADGGGALVARVAGLLGR